MCKILVINISDNSELTEFTDKIKKKIIEFGLQSISIHYKESKMINLNLFDSFIFSPTSLGKNSEFDMAEWDSKIEYTTSVFALKKPILGICGGHLLIGRFFGANVIIDKEKEIGENDHVNIVKENDTIFKNIKESVITVKQMHNNSTELPKNFTLLASSEKCKVQLMKSEESNIYSSQFHIEENDILFSNYLNLIKNLV